MKYVQLINCVSPIKITAMNYLRLITIYLNHTLSVEVNFVI